MADTAAFDAALIHLSLGPDKRVGALTVGFSKRIIVTPESLTGAKNAPCRDFSPRWKTANRGVNNLAGTRGMSKIAGLAMGRVRISALRSPFQSARKLLRARRGRRAFVRWKLEEELCYVASEARFEGQAPK
ncbi:MAG: hypothetical protein WBD65_05570 [Methylocella sp.]